MFASVDVINLLRTQARVSVLEKICFSSRQLALLKLHKEHFLIESNDSDENKTESERGYTGFVAPISQEDCIKESKRKQKLVDALLGYRIRNRFEKRLWDGITPLGAQNLDLNQISPGPTSFSDTNRV